MNTGIYTITNLVNGKIYVGKSTNLKSRIYDHKWKLKNNKHPNKYLQYSYNKYTKDNFIFEILDNYEEEHLSSFETYWINILNTTNRKFGYNLTSGTNSNGFRHLESTKIIIGNCNKGKKYSKERCKNISNALKGKKKSKSHIENYIKNRRIPVIQLDFNDKFIKEWDSISNAGRDLKIIKSNISRCCKGITKTVNGFKWCYSKEYYNKIK